MYKGEIRLEIFEGNNNHFSNCNREYPLKPNLECNRLRGVTRGTREEAKVSGIGEGRRVRIGRVLKDGKRKKEGIFFNMKRKR